MMRLQARVAQFLTLVLLVVAPVAGARAQTAATAATDSPRGQIVAFGLSDEQNVFHSEATQAAAILARRYGNGVTPLVYTNTRRASRATVTNLRAALAKAAARMDRENDVLFVFLTSHGSRDGIALKAGRRFGLLTPAQLGALLRDTGVRNKVLIVSACFSGIFTPLADPQTLVITAADATHPSFGCEATATWTFFGRAFFRDALPKTDNLRDAYALARASVLARERREGFEPSNPQMAGGQTLLPRLRAAP